MSEEDAELVNPLDHLEGKRLVWAIVLLKVCMDGRGGGVQGNCADDEEHGRQLDFEEGKIAGELCLDDSTDVRQPGKLALFY